MCERCNGNMVHLHVHTNMSLLDGASDPKSLISHVDSIGQSAVAITDHGVMSGVVGFAKLATSQGIKPIIGMEGYLAEDSRYRKDAQLDRKPYHLLMLAKNQTGYHNLMKISSYAYTEGFYYRPRSDWELLERHHEGIIVTSGCLAGEVPQFLLKGDEKEAKKRLERYRDVFGDDFYLEVQYRLNSTDQHYVNRWMIQYGKTHDIPVVATTDAHYVRQEDASMHDTLLCIQTADYKDTPKDLRNLVFDEDTYYITEEHTMRSFFSGAEYVVDNTFEVAKKCSVDLVTPQGYHLPDYPVPDGFDDTEDMLYALCQSGLKWRYPDTYDTAEVQNRLDRELGIIHDMGFDTYFLIVWDLCEFARHADIWWNVRGSGAGSIVAYVLGITSIDPLMSDLMFERFLNPSRVSMPDIDLDYEDERRNEMVDYLVWRYGDDRVAGIITFGTLSGKSAIRNVARVMQVDQEKTAQIAKRIVTQQGRTKPLDHYLETDPVLMHMYTSDPEVKAVWDESSRIQGYPRHSSTHPAGFIVTPDALVNYVPLHRLTGKAFGENTPLQAVVQFDMETAEEVGLLKIDFLGLSTLSVMKKACEYIKDRHGHDWTIYNIPYRHETVRSDLERKMLDETFAFIGEGETAGVFQIEGSGMTSLMKHMKPRSFDNITAALALYRPGPMGVGAHETYVDRLHGLESPDYIHPELENILGDTYGLLVFQEQVMAVASQMFGYEPGEADLIRKAVGKKKQKELAKHYSRFVEEGEKRGIPVDTVEQIWNQIEYFADYGFNRAHASDYAKVCVQTAFLKTHYLIEYMTALLRVYLDNPDKLAHYLDECRRLGIPVLPPDVNRSQKSFSIEILPDGTEAIRCGLMAVKYVGDKPSELILESRGSKPFRTLGELVYRLDLSKVNKRALEALIYVGAFADFGDRWDLYCAMIADSPKGHTDLRAYSKNLWKPRRKKQKQKEVGVVQAMDMFAMMDFEPQHPEVALSDFLPEKCLERPSTRHLLDFEKEFIGFYVTQRPSDGYRNFLRENAKSSIHEATKDGIESEFVGHNLAFGGEVLTVRTILDKRDRPMSFVTLQDWHETASVIDVVVFSKEWKKYAHWLKEGSVVVIIGTLGIRHGEFNFIANKVRKATSDKGWRLD